jgi:tetratricopeptide (TPR) repeat protein
MKAHTTILSVILILALGSGLAASMQAGIQQQAWSYILQARQGDAAAADKAVKLLEQATAATPNDIALWNLLGRSYFLRLSTQSRAAVGIDGIASAVKAAANAFAHALSQNPNDAGALSGHGMALTLQGAFQQTQTTLAQGVEEMNRAVEIDPSATHPRLTRGFTMVNMPVSVRNTAAVIDDLSHLLQAATRSNQRAVDSLHIMLGDIYFESGQTDQARRHYDAAKTEGSTQQDEAKSRLAALEKGSVPSADITRFRGGLGTNCTMCHAK